MSPPNLSGNRTPQAEGTNQYQEYRFDQTEVASQYEQYRPDPAEVTSQYQQYRPDQADEVTSLYQQYRPDQAEVTSQYQQYRPDQAEADNSHNNLNTKRDTESNYKDHDYEEIKDKGTPSQISENNQCLQKVSVAIDFGTSNCAVAFSAHSKQEDVFAIKEWNDGDKHGKIPTAVLFNDKKEFVAF